MTETTEISRVRVSTEVRAILRKIAPAGQGDVRLDGPWHAANLDSLDIIDLVVSLEAAFDISVPDPVVTSCHSPGELVDAVASIVRCRGDISSSETA